MRLPDLKIMVVAIFVILGSGCGRSVLDRQKLSWPPPPDKPLIVHKASIYDSTSLPRSFFGKVKDFLFGKPPEMDIVKPYGVVYDGNSKLFIVDTGKKGILVFDLKSGGTDFINSIGSYGILGEPIGIAIDGEGRLYVSDTKLHKVVVFRKDYTFSHFIGVNGELENPVGLAITKDQKRIFIVDSALNCVKQFDLSGNFLGEFGKRGDNQGEFYFPLGIALNNNDTIYVVDSFHFAVQAFDIEGNFLFSFGPIEQKVSRFARPRDIAINSENLLFVTDALNHNVQIFDRSGRFILEFGNAGLDEGQFRLPAGIFIADNEIYVSDSINRRIQIFDYIKEN
jgi:DNA-binding beta-propeller fold protein YncE